MPKEGRARYANVYCHREWKWKEEEGKGERDKRKGKEKEKGKGKLEVKLWQKWKNCKCPILESNQGSQFRFPFPFPFPSPSDLSFALKTHSLHLYQILLSLPNNSFTLSPKPFHSSGSHLSPARFLCWPWLYFPRVLRHHYRARNWTFDENHFWSLLKVPFKTDLLVKIVWKNSVAKLV